MFHCNGWCFPWAVTAAGGPTCACRRSIAAESGDSFDAGVTHLNGAPTVLSMLGLARARPGDTAAPVRIGTGGAPPTPAILERMAELGVDVTHLYGLTETFGPVMICDWRREWNGLDAPAQARLKARQGVGNMISCRVRVVDESGGDLPADGAAVGEIALRGNNVMLGYLRTTPRRRRPHPMVGSAPATSGSCTPTAMSSSATVART